mmetsp:Transcript_15522/g.44134  ORF Transcript_15522/g.44134 Transcript_15522/m.44134 type:complete len:217 (+) Transcript_15522:1795-2445(+)
MLWVINTTEISSLFVRDLNLSSISARLVGGFSVTIKKLVFFLMSWCPIPHRSSPVAVSASAIKPMRPEDCPDVVGSMFPALCAQRGADARAGLMMIRTDTILLLWLKPNGFVCLFVSSLQFSVLSLSVLKVGRGHCEECQGRVISAGSLGRSPTRKRRDETVPVVVRLRNQAFGRSHLLNVRRRDGLAFWPCLGNTGRKQLRQVGLQQLGRSRSVR